MNPISSFRGWLGRLSGGIVQRGTDNPFFHALLQGWSGNVAGEQFTKPYGMSPWVQRAIKMVCEPIASVPLKFYENTPSGKIDFNSPELEDFWNAPAMGPDGPISLPDVVVALGAWLKLEGNAFVILDPTWLDRRAANKEPFTIARPSRMQPVKDGLTLQGWLYNYGTGGMATALLPEEVRQLKFFNPYDDFLGLSELSAAGVSAETDWLAGEMARNVMRNNGDRGQIITSKGIVPNKDQKEEINRMLREKREMSQRGIFKTLYLGGDVSVADPKLQALDAAFNESRVKDRESVAAAFGIPLTLFQLGTSHAIQGASDRYKLIEDTCMPLAAKIASLFGQISALYLNRPKPLLCEFDFDQHSVIAENRLAKFTVAKDMQALGIDLKTSNQYLALGLPEVEGWEQCYIPMNMIPADQVQGLTALKNDPSLGEELTPTDEKEAKARVIDPAARVAALIAARGFKQLPTRKVIELLEKPIPAPAAAGGSEPDDLAVAASLCGHTPSPNAIIGRAPARDHLWAAHMAKRKPTVNAFRLKVAKTLLIARAETLKKIENAQRYEAKAVDPVTRKSALDLVFDLVRFGTALWVALSKVEQQALDEAGQQMNDELDVKSVWNTPNAAAAEYLGQRENLIKRASQTVFDQIKATLQEGIDNSENYDQLAARVKTAFNDLAKWEAMRIAQTETAAAFGLARDLSQKEAGVQFKEWLTSRNNNVRPWHQEAEGQQVAFDQKFKVGPDLLDFPGDSSGEAANVINCHCVSIAIKKPAAQPDETEAP